MREQKKMLRFVAYAFALCIGWFILYDFWLSDFDKYLTLAVVDASVYALKLLGYSAAAKDIMVQIDGEDTVFVYHACNGMILMALFIGFILAFPGPIKKKLFYIPFGLIIINVLNVLRVTALALNAHYFHQTLSFNHKYTFTVIVYAAIFALWMLWVKKFSGLSKNANATIPEVQTT